MKRVTRKGLPIILAVTLALLVIAGSFLFSDKSAQTISIYHTNDVHGYLEAEENEETGVLEKPGAAHLAALHSADPNSLLVDAGDWSQGSLFANLSRGQSCVEVMNQVGYDVVALGNHEFDYSADVLEQNLAAAKFEFVCANIAIDSANAGRLPKLASVPPYVIKTVGGRRIAFLSMNTPELSGMMSPAELKAGGIIVNTDIVTLAGELVAELKAQRPAVDAIIAITHCGATEGGSSQSAYDIAKVAGIDAVIDGHDHALRLDKTAVQVDNTLIVSTGTQLYNIGKLELSFAGKKLTVTSTDVTKEALAATPDKAVEEIIGRWNTQFEEVKSKVVFRSEVNIWGGNVFGWDAGNNEVRASIARRGESSGGSLAADARRWKAQQWLKDNASAEAYKAMNLQEDMPIVVLNVGGSVRDSFRAGDVTLGSLMTAYAFGFEDAEDSYLLITPRVLYDMLEHGVNIFKGQDKATGVLEADGGIHGRFPQASGFTYQYDINRPASGECDEETPKMPDVGSRIVSVKLADGSTLDRKDDTTQILLVSSGYETSGGDGYWMLGMLNDQPNYGGYREIQQVATPAGNYGDAIAEYVNAVYGGTIPADAYPINSGRITRVNDQYTGAGYQSVIRVTKDKETALPNTTLQCYVNGVASTVTTDANGEVKLELPNGPAEVRLISKELGYDSGTCYLDNYCGLINLITTHSPGEPLPK